MRVILLMVGLAVPPSSAMCGLKLVQWNMHGECFNQCGPGQWVHCDKNYPSCKDNAVDLAKFLLAGNDDTPAIPPDFLALEQMGDEDFHRETANALGYGQVSHICGGEQGFGRYPFDIAILFYRLDRWTPVNGPDGGCMERLPGYARNNYRAYVMQAFERIDGQRVVAVAAHLSHSVFGFDHFGAAIQQSMGAASTTQAVLMMDSNRECGTSSWKIMQDVLPHTNSATKLTSNRLSRTCCVPRFQHCYDRIVALGFNDVAAAEMDTQQAFQKEAPPWSAENMHEPIVSRLVYQGCGEVVAFPDPGAAVVPSQALQEFNPIAGPVQERRLSLV